MLNIVGTAGIVAGVAKPRSHLFMVQETKVMLGRNIEAKFWQVLLSAAVIVAGMAASYSRSETMIRKNDEKNREQDVALTQLQTLQLQLERDLNARTADRFYRSDGERHMQLINGNGTEIAVLKAQFSTLKEDIKEMKRMSEQTYRAVMAISNGMAAEEP